MATKYKLRLSKSLEQFIRTTVPDLPSNEDWSMTLRFDCDSSVNNAIFSKFSPGEAFYKPNLVMKAAGNFLFTSGGGTDFTYGSNLAMSDSNTLTFTHLASNQSETVIDLNGQLVSTTNGLLGLFSFNNFFALVRDASGGSSFYYNIDVYSIEIASPTFTETWDANLIGSSGSVTTLPSVSGTRDAQLPNGGESIAYDDGAVGGGNTKPVAVLGADGAINTGATFTADASASYDDDNDAITYLTTLSAPAGSSATLSNATTNAPYFTADVDGAYTLTLVVNDGTEDSDPVTQTLTATTSSGSVSDSGNDSVSYIGSPATLDGSASVGSVFSWSFTQRPTGSSAVISNAASQSASFIPDVSGLYKVQLDVDGVTSEVNVRAKEAAPNRAISTAIRGVGEFALGRKITLIAEGEYNA